MASTGKRAMSVVIGLLASMIVLTLLEYINSRLFPFPENIDMKDPIAIKTAIDSMPLGAKVLHIFSYFIASIVGGMVSTKLIISESKNPALIVGGILTFLGLVNTVTMGEELWMSVLTLLIYMPGAYLGYMIIAGKKHVS